MDVGMLKSTATEDQMEMLMMMQTDKFPELCGLPYNNSSDILELEYSGTSTASNGTTTTPIFHNNPHIQVASPTLLNSPASIPFMGITTTFQEAMASPLLPNLNVSEKIYPSPIFPEFVKQNGSMAAMREMMFRIAAMQPIQIDPESVKAPKRKNVKISKDPQSVAARHRRERISEKIRILQRLVPGGTKMDTASMLDEAIHYVKFLKKQVQSLERVSSSNNRPPMAGFPAAHANYSSLFKTCQPSHQMVGSMQMLR